MKNFFLRVRLVILYLMTLAFTGDGFSQVSEDPYLAAVAKYEMTSYSLVVNDTTVYTFKAPVELIDDLDEYFERARKHNIDLSNVANLQGIYLVDFSKSSILKEYDGNFGVSLKDECIIGINRANIPRYLPTFLNAVMYHELWHFIPEAYFHSTFITSPTVTRGGEHINVEDLISTWRERSKEEYFEYLKGYEVFKKEKQRKIESQDSTTTASLKEMPIVEIVTATVYNAVPEQCNDDPEHTAFMFKLDLTNPYKHRIIAVSRDLLKKFPGRSKVRITGTSYDGIYTVLDKMNKRYTKRIDILINEDMSIGKWRNVKIELIK